MSRKKSDANQTAIVVALRRCGVHVTDTHSLGHGFPDITTIYGGKVRVIEIKSKTGTLTTDEEEWWNRTGLKPVIVRTVNEALKLHGII